MKTTNHKRKIETLGTHLRGDRDDARPRRLVLAARPVALADSAGRGASRPGEEHGVREDGDEVGRGEGEPGPAVRRVVKKWGEGRRGREEDGEGAKEKRRSFSLVSSPLEQQNN